MDLPVMPPIKPMLAKALDKLPDGELALEPKWDGFRCIVFKDGDEIVLGSRNQKPFNRYFPELFEPLRASLPERCVVDGELIVEIDGSLDFDALGQRIHPAESRVNMLAEKTPVSFVAFDALALGDEGLLDTPFIERRAILESLAPEFVESIHLAPMTTDRTQAMEWFHTLEGAGLDGLIAKPLDGVYVQDKRVQFKLKHVRTIDCVVAGYRIHKSGDGVGSLVLGLYDDDGSLRHVGVSASFTAKKRVELREEMAPFVLDDISSHPWASWMQAEAHIDGSMPGAPNRWSGANGRDHSWIPVRPERVVEVKYVLATDGRFRGTTRFLRWRPDRTPESATLDQFPTLEPFDITNVLT
ncbi:MAG: ATP-dependent DNA ligase [Acidimicrobiia bacterium]|nr:ATP-dependent DNA ligase [Acidimicrobiia bacterium]